MNRFLFGTVRRAKRSPQCDMRLIPWTNWPGSRDLFELVQWRAVAILATVSVAAGSATLLAFAR
jgi:hypothetical protein